MSKKKITPNPLNGDVFTPEDFREVWSDIGQLLENRTKTAEKKMKKYKGLDDKSSDNFLMRMKELYSFQHLIFSCGHVVHENSTLKRVISELAVRVHELEHACDNKENDVKM